MRVERLIARHLKLALAAGGALLAVGGCQHAPMSVSHRDLKTQTFTQPATAPADAASADATPSSARTQPPVLNELPDNIPVETPIGKSSGSFMILGGVVAEVDSTPIYANKVLAELDLPLRQKARELDDKQFLSFARSTISDEVIKLVHEELEFAAAKRSLEADDLRMAEAATQDWRKKQISAAGGSLEVARSKAAKDGNNFDDLVQQQYRAMVVELYYEKKIFPKIQISADDLRRYYERHQEDEFTQHSAARFRVIKIDFNANGGRDKALAKATDMQARLAKGWNFADLASTENDDAYLAKNAGFPAQDKGFMSKGAYALENVEDAVWKLQPGQVTAVIEGPRACYIAKLEERHDGKVQPFDEPATQARIRAEMEREQLNVLRQAHLMELEQRASVSMTEQMMNIALDMAMQKYRQWTIK